MGSSPIRVATRYASVAQLVEQRTENPRVVGSIPTGGTIYADLAHLVERHLAKVEVAGSSPVIRSNRNSTQQGAFLFLWSGCRGVHPPRTLWVLGFERLKHSRTIRKDKPCFYYFLFLRIRYEYNNTQLLYSAHVIRSNRNSTG